MRSLDPNGSSPFTGRPASKPHPRSLPYVLVADADTRRTELCLEAIKPHGVGALVARHHDEAMGALRDFGAPLLLIADLLLPPQDGFTVIETARRIGVDRERTRILAWSATREVREFAACRLAGLNVRVLAGSVSASVIGSAIGRLLRGGTQADPSFAADSASAEAAHQTMEELAARARDICGTAGVAVYLKGGANEPFRSASTWLADEPIPGSLDQLPMTLERIIETREPLVALDLARDRSPEELRRAGDGPRGFVAVPITDADDDIAGMICVFDIKPLTIGNVEMEALKALGHHGAVMRPRARTLAVRPPAQPRAYAPFDPSSHGFGLPSTGQAVTLLDRHAGSVVVTREMARARREQNHLSVVVLDVDAADSDAAAPDPTDDPIESAGHALTRVIRGYDLAIRWSRQELVLVLPGVGGFDAGRVAERVRAAIQSGDSSGLAVAGGVAELEDDSTLESIVLRANQKARQSKDQNSLHL